MKASDYFKSMEEVQRFCEGFKSQCNSDEYKTLLMVFGLGEQEGTFKEVPRVGKIDISITDYIAELNQSGLHTLASCSGLLRDHPGWDESKAGYISFVLNPLAVEGVTAATKRIGLKCEESETYLQPSLYVRIEGNTDDVKEYTWRALVDAILEEVNKKHK